MAELVRIGFNSQDRFMTAIGHTLAVITQTGNVFGADVVNRELQPVFQFGGAKIGFNPEDRFVVTVGTTIVVITRDGRVFGSEVTGRELGPVFQFSGSRIGFNPQDRFMVAVGHTLVVITNGGSVFGADVSDRNIGPVSQFASATIGFNPQDRFMVAIGKSGGFNPAERPIGTLAVITNSGSVFGADIVSHQIGIIDPTSPGGPHLIKRDLSPVIQFGGAKIGFNPQDRFMVAMGQTLAVITSEGNVFGADVVGRDVGPVFRITNDNAKPLTLDLRANPDNLQINPELVIIGHGFTANGRFRYTVHNWPKVQDIHNQGALDVNGSFERTESRGFASIRIDVDVPDIEVTAVDEATGHSITASVSAEKFIARFG